MSRNLLSAIAVAACAIGSVTRAAEPGETTIGGKGFFDLTNIDETSDGTKADASGTGLDVKRFYFSVSHQFDKRWSANLTTDFNYVSNDSETQLFVKKAYFEGKFSDAFTLRVGSADVPLVPFVEGLYLNRYIENVLVEHLGIEASADWGVHALGAFAGGKAHYAVSAINGNGYKNTSRSRSLDLDTRVDFEPVDGLTLAVAYRTGKRGLDRQTVTTYHTANRTELLAVYVKEKFRVGAELFQTDNWNQVLSPLSDSGDGHSIWGMYSIKKNVSLFARYDDAKPSKDLAPTLENKYFNLGVVFQPVAKVDLAVVYKQDKVENGTLKTSNGTIGGTTVGKRNEIGLWAQVQF
jgi:Phosphate-selective porin O and P